MLSDKNTLSPLKLNLSDVFYHQRLKTYLPGMSPEGLLVHFWGWAV